MKLMRSATVAALLASFVSIQPPPVAAQGRWERDRDRYERQQERRERREARERREYREYRREVARREAQRDYWDAARYYRQGDRYRARRMGRSDRIYRGSDNRYYCKRDDGTTGLIIGAGIGALLGNSVDVGGSRTLNTILGGVAGAAIGASIDRGNIRCD